MNEHTSSNREPDRARLLADHKSVVAHHRSRSGIVTAAVAHGLPEYFIEMIGLAIFMISASAFTVLIEHPSSPLRMAVESPLLRRAMIGLAMGLTAIGIIYSPWGRRSGAHINPAVTLAFFRLGKMDLNHTLYYIAAQFVGGLVGVYIALALFGDYLSHPAVNFVATVPGSGGPIIALIAEVAISFLLMSAVLRVSNSQRFSAYTGIVAGATVAAFITLEAPLSGMSMNPARTFGSALPASTFTDLWVYFVAPIIGMLLAAELYARRHGVQNVLCAKLHHSHALENCVFRCLLGRESTRDNKPADTNH